MGGKQESRLRREQLLALLDSANRLSSQLELSEVLQSILDIACEVSSSTAGSVILHDPHFDDLYFAAATGPVAGELPSIRIPPGQGVAGKVFATREPVIVNDAARKRDHYRVVDEQTTFTTTSMVCVPLVYGSSCYGVIQILNKSDGGGAYDEEDLELLQNLATQSAIAIQNSRVFERLIASSGLYSAPDSRQDLVSGMAAGEVPARRELLSVLFGDMRGFTQLCTIMASPERIQEMLSQFLAMLARVVVDNHGIVNKFIGDGVMAIFRGEEASKNAVRAAFEMIEGFERLLSEWSRKTSRSLRFLDFGSGIVTDEMIIGTIGAEGVSEFTAIGTPVVLAAALERDARGGKRVLCDRLTYQGASSIIQVAEGPSTYRLKKPDQDVPLDFEIFEVMQLRPRGGTGRIFVSYDQEDVERVADLIVNPLLENGIDVFFSQDSIQPGEDFSERVGRALADSVWFVVAVTENSVRSRWVREEVKFALEADHLEGRIVTVRLDDAPIEKIDWRLGRRQYLDAFGTDGRDVGGRIVAAIGAS